jgi:hypothetical protein
MFGKKFIQRWITQILQLRSVRLDQVFIVPFTVLRKPCVGVCQPCGCTLLR